MPKVNFQAFKELGTYPKEDKLLFGPRKVMNPYCWFYDFVNVHCGNLPLWNGLHLQSRKTVYKGWWYSMEWKASAFTIYPFWVLLHNVTLQWCYEVPLQGCKRNCDVLVSKYFFVHWFFFCMPRSTLKMLSRTDFLTKYFTILTRNCLSFHRSHHPPKRFYGVYI